MTSTSTEPTSVTVDVPPPAKRPFLDARRINTIDDDSRHTIATWCAGRTVGLDSIAVDTADGSECAGPGDWIVKIDDDDFLVCTHDTFTAMFLDGSAPS